MLWILIIDREKYVHDRKLFGTCPLIVENFWLSVGNILGYWFVGRKVICVFHKAIFFCILLPATR